MPDSPDVPVTATAPRGLEWSVLALARSRDPEAWAVLVQEAGEDILGVARRLAGDRELAKDALQETLLRVRDAAGNYRVIGGGGDADARRWILGVAANTTLKLVRGARRARARDRRAGTARTARSDAPGPDEALILAERLDLVRGELARLPELSGRAIVMHHLCGLPFEAVAAELRMPVGTAKTRVRRGLDVMRRRLAKHGVALSAVALVSAVERLPAVEVATSAATLAPAVGATSSITSAAAAALAAKLAIGVLALALATAGVVVAARPPPAPTIGSVQATPGWNTFAQALPRGLVTGPVSLAGVASQCDVKATWPDGSTRLAIITCRAEQAATLALRGRPDAQKDPGTWRDAPAAEVALTIGAERFVARAPAQPTPDRWLDGPLAREWRATVAPASPAGPHPTLRVRFDARLHPDGAGRVDIAVENGLDVAGAGALTYDVEVRVADRVAFSRQGLQHWYLTRWRCTVPFGGAPGTPTPDIELLHRSGAVPRFAAGIAPDAAPIDEAEFAPLAHGGLVAFEADQHGLHPETGPYPAWVARWLAHPDAVQTRRLLAYGTVAGSWPIHLREADDTPVSIDRRPGFWLDERGKAASEPDRPRGDLTEAGLGPFRADVAHQPSLAYVPWLVTGDRWYADEVAAWADYALLSRHPAYGRGGAAGLLGHVEASEFAWTLRNLVDAAAWLPDADPRRASFAAKVAANLRWADAYATGAEVAMPASGDAIGSLYERVRPKAGGGSELLIAPFHLQALTWSLGHAADQGFGGGEAMRRRLAAFAVALLDGRSVPRERLLRDWLVVGAVDADGSRHHLPDLRAVDAATPDAPPGADGILSARWAVAEAQRLGIAGSDEVARWLDATVPPGDFSRLPGWAVSRPGR